MADEEIDKAARQERKGARVYDDAFNEVGGSLPLCGCAICGARHLYGVDVPTAKDAPWPTYEQLGSPPDHGRQNRIEALRAASRIVASATHPDLELQVSGKSASVEQWTLHVAEQFAHWLETGER